MLQLLDVVALEDVAAFLPYVMIQFPSEHAPSCTSSKMCPKIRYSRTAQVHAVLLKLECVSRIPWSVMLAKLDNDQLSRVRGQRGICRAFLRARRSPYDPLALL